MSGPGVAVDTEGVYFEALCFGVLGEIKDLAFEVFVTEEPHKSAAGILFGLNILEAQIISSLMNSEYSMISR